MVEKVVLEEIGKAVLEQLGLRRWRVYYADSEPEKIEDKRPAPNSAANLRFHLHTDDGVTAYIIRVRVSAQALREPRARNEEIRRQLYAGLRRAHFEESTH